MRLATVVVALLIAYGSLYPFDVKLDAAVDWSAFVATLGQRLSRGDLLANVVLFVPLGFFAAAGWRSELAGLRAWTWGRALAIAAACFVFAAALQVLQLYFPGRDPNLQDAVWNLLGTLIGMATARVLIPRADAMSPDLGGAPTGYFWVSAALAASWAAYKLSPFVPSLDVQNFKDGLKPLYAAFATGRPADLVPGNFTAGFGLYRSVVLWSTFAWLCSRSFLSAPRDAHLLWLVPALLAGQLLMVDNTLFPADVIGAAVAVLIWFVWLRRSSRSTSLLMLVLLSVIVVDGLMPFQLSGVVGQFYWVPFHGFLTGSMLVNVSSLLLKTFMYGAGLWLLRESSGQIVAATLFLVLITGFVEGAQLFLGERTAEITDPIFVLGLGIGMAVLAPRRRGSRSVRHASAARA